jgi:hypothetical protein
VNGCRVVVGVIVVVAVIEEEVLKERCMSLG